MPKRKKLLTKPTRKLIKKASPLSKSKKPHRSLFSFKLIFILGFLLFGVSFVYHIHQLVQLTFYHQQLPSVSTNRTTRPVEVTIDSIDLDLPVSETVIANNTWQIADNSISHLAISARPGENNSIILYGHNTDDRFGPLLWMKTGESITLTTTDGKHFTYIVKTIVTVDPNNTKVLTSQKGETLILYTCTGFADLQRYVLIAKPKSE